MNLVTALLSFVSGIVLSLHHPLAQPLPVLAFVACTAAAYLWPSAWLIAVPAILPLIGQAPWSGWITFEELDLLILAVAAGGYFRGHFARRLGRSAEAESRVPIAAIMLGGLALVSVAVSMVRGFLDAGGFEFGWFQAYDGPMNSLRIGKILVLALLVLPLFNRLLGQNPDRTLRSLGIGLACGLLTASMAALAERYVYTGLLNFSSDYRTTALFWEMHVGGAALDGWLMLTLPFAAWALRRSRTAWSWCMAVVLLGLGGYASLTTFSRGVYLALGAMIAVLVIGLWGTRKYSGEPAEGRLSHISWVAALTVFTVMATCVFPNAGYRGLLALLGVQLVGLRMPTVVRPMPGIAMALAGAAGIVVGLVLIPVAALFPKGAYVAYAVVFLITLALLASAEFRQPSGGQQKATVVAAASLCVLAGNVGYHWGGDGAIAGFVAAIVMALLLMVLGGRSRIRLWPDGLRSQSALLVAAGVVGGIVAVFQGGAYMGGRFAATSQDMKGRIEHWEHGLEMLTTPSDWIFGKGLGRFPGIYFFSNAATAFPASYKLATEAGNHFLTVTGSHHKMSDGKIIRVSQRLAVEPGRRISVTMSLRARNDVTVLVELCDKHLLYAENCTSHRIPVKPDNTWRSVTFPLDVAPHAMSGWLSPRFRVFSLGTGTKAGIADIDNIAVLDPAGREIIANGDFTAGMAHWFFTSDHDHMPWHAKNLLVAVAIDQGLFGAVVLAALVFAALWRLLAGAAKSLEISPYIAASLVGFLVVGIFDSLVDVPRVAYQFYFLAFVALLLGKRPRAPGGKHRGEGGGAMAQGPRK